MGFEVLAEMERDDRRRRFLGAEPVVVARGRYAAAQQIAVPVDAAQQGRAEGDEAPVLVLGLSRHEQVDAGVGVQPPIVVLSGAVDPGERFLVEQDREVVFEGEVAEHVHGEDIGIRREVGQAEDRRNLVLCRGHLVVGAMDRDPELPHLLPRLGDIAVDPRRQPGEVVGGHFLTAQRRRSQQRAPGGDQIGPGEVFLPVDQEEFLFPADIAHDLPGDGIPEEREQSHTLLVDRHVGAQQGGFLVESLPFQVTKADGIYSVSR